MIFRILLFTFLCTQVQIVFAQQTTATIKTNVEVGNLYRIIIPYKMLMDMTIKIDTVKMKNMFDENEGETADNFSMEQKQKMIMTMEMALLLKVVKKYDDNSILLETQYEYLENIGEVENETYTISTKQENNKLTDEQKNEIKRIKSIMGKKFEILIDKNGKVKKVDNYDKIIELLYDKDVPKEMQKSYTIDQISEDQIYSYFNSVLGIIPYKTVAIGESWSTVDTQTISIFQTRIVNTYTLKEITDTHYNIDVISETNSISTDKNSMTSKSLGTIKLLKADCFQQQQSYSMNMDMTMRMFKGMEMLSITNATGTYVVEKIIK